MAETIEREHLARIISDLIEEHAHCDTRWPATARIAQDKALVFADAIIDRLPAAGASQSTERDRALEEAAQRAEAEPEFPDEPSDEVLAAMQSVHPIENARAACRATKKAIAAAIRAMQTSAAAHTRSNAADMEG